MTFPSYSKLMTKCLSSNMNGFDANKLGIFTISGYFRKATLFSWEEFIFSLFNFNVISIFNESLIFIFKKPPC